MKTKIKFLLLVLCNLLLLSALNAQRYETTGVVTIGSGILSSETYNTVVILGDPSASDDMLDGENISVNTGFIFVEEEPFTVLGAGTELTFSIFPNPVSNFLTIRTGEPGNGAYIIRVLSLDGSVYLKKELPNDGFNELVLDVSGLIKSVYILSVTSPTGETGNYKFSKH